MDAKELQERMKEADFDQVEKMMRLFDRVLLYNLAVHSMPDEFLEKAVELWDKIVKMGIDRDASVRTDILESTVAGRRAKFGQMADGEKVRLEGLKQWQIARDIITSNLQRPEDQKEF
jgi:hypothetical protein